MWVQTRRNSPNSRRGTVGGTFPIVGVVHEPRRAARVGSLPVPSAVASLSSAGAGSNGLPGARHRTRGGRAAERMERRGEEGSRPERGAPVGERDGERDGEGRQPEGTLAKAVARARRIQADRQAEKVPDQLAKNPRQYRKSQRPGAAAAPGGTATDRFASGAAERERERSGSDPGSPPADTGSVPGLERSQFTGAVSG